MAEYIELSQATTLFGDVDARFDTVEGKIPSNASSSNKLATASDITSITEKIPVNASSSNKLVTEADIAAAYHAAGTKTVAELLSSLLVAANEGNVYNMTDAGTTTSDFIEGAGKPIRIGDNVGVCKVGNDYKFDLLSGFIDTSNFVEKSSTSGLLKNDGTVDTTSYVETVSGKGLSTNDYSDNDKTALQTTIPLEISQLQGSLLNKVDKEVGKGLSTNDYDATAKGIVDSIPLTVSQLQGSLLEKFPRSEQRVLGAKNWFNPYGSWNGSQAATQTISDAGKEINITSSSEGTYRNRDIFIDVAKNTDYTLTADIAISSGSGLITIKDATDTNVIVETTPITSNKSVSLTFNSGNNKKVKVILFCTTVTSAVGDVTYNNLLLTLASDTDRTWTPYAMTNRELTETLSVQESAVTDIPAGFPVDSTIGNHLAKYGKVVVLDLGVNGVTMNEWTGLGTIPDGYKPKNRIHIKEFYGKNMAITKTGSILAMENITSSTVLLHATWITP